MRVALIYASEKNHGFPPLGIASLAAVIKENLSDVEIKLYDRIPDNEFQSNYFDLIGISSITLCFSMAHKFCMELRKEFKGIIVLGGIHFTLQKKLPSWADIGVIGEGEITFLELINLYISSQFTYSKLANINGIAFRSANSVFFTNPRKLIENIDVLPFPARGLFNIENYLKNNNSFGTKIGRGLSLVTSRGCSYDCPFCAATKLWKTTRYFSPQHIVSEIKYLIDLYNVELIYIADDNFCSQKSRLQEIANLIEKEKIKIEFGVSGRIEFYTPEIRDLFRRIGIKFISFGFETGSDRMLKIIKHNSKFTVKKTIERAKQVIADGFEIQGLFMLNLPYETKEDIDMTVEMIYDIPMVKLGLTIATPFYGTEWWNIAVDQKVVPKNPDWEFWNKCNVSVLNNESILFKNDVNLEYLQKVYSELIEYKEKLFFFDWENR